MTPDIDIILARYVMATRHHPIAPSATFAELGLDAIDVAMLAMDIEDTFDIRLSDETINAWSCVADVVQSVGKVAA
jgi:acyl carrier protein